MKLLWLLLALASAFAHADGLPHVASAEPSSSCTDTDGPHVKPETDDADPLSSFVIEPNSSITDFLSPKLLNDTVLADIKSSLLSGKVVVIKDAFIPEFAEHAWEQISTNDTGWNHSIQYSPTVYRRPNLIIKKTPTGEISPETIAEMKSSLETSHMSVDPKVFQPNNPGHNGQKHYDFGHAWVKNILQHASTKEFLTSISGRNLQRVAPMTTEYREGDYSNPHTDFSGASLAFVWNLSKDWDPSWGGAFYWGDASTLEDGFFYPTFNTLILSLPTRVSTHFVSPVNQNAEGRRLSITAYFDQKIQAGIDGSIFMYRKKEDHIMLDFNEAVWIAHEMDPDTYTNDPIRQQHLWEMKQSVKENYLHPDDHASFVVSWSEEEQDEASGADSDEVDSDDNEIKEIDVEIKRDSSILDFMDPSILEDEELLADIKTNLLQGKLVVIEEAFKLEFAKYAWGLLDGDDIKWESAIDETYDQTLSRTPGSTYSKHVPSKASLSDKIVNVLELFKNPKTKEFLQSLSGRSCLGPDPTINPIWHQQGDYTNPQTDFEGDNSLSFSWILSKDWDLTYGGAFYWFPTKSMDGGYNHASFNTLVLFLPTPSSTHLITPVSWWSEGKRLSIGGRYHAGHSFAQCSVEKDIEKLLNVEEDYISLTSTDANWIANDMDVDEMTNDPNEQKILYGLKEGVSSKYLHPLQVGDALVL